MIDFIKFLFSKRFIVHLIVAGLITGGGLWSVFQYLDSYTLHGQTITVPDFSGKTIAEIEDFASEYDLGYKIIDSVYKPNFAKGAVLEQNPKPESQVKKDRKIYLTVSRVLPPLIELPELKDVTSRIAFGIIESKGLRIGEIIYEPNIAVDAVIRLEIEGKEIDGKIKVAKNTKIDIVLGLGESDEKIAIPNLVSLTEAKARLVLREMILGFGINECELRETEEDSINAKIYRQAPEYDSTAAINLGSTIDVWRTIDPAKWPSVNLPNDSLINDSISDN
ncbi:MAG: PASTA domain-containing protein [Flavobacteriales bacterium]|nr:PASTA domain-containing protein [Flavobacteriales bacterium]